MKKCLCTSCRTELCVWKPTKSDYPMRKSRCHDPLINFLFTVQTNETQFFVFHESGIAVYDPTNCRIQHQILAKDIIPGTQVKKEEFIQNPI